MLGQKPILCLDFDGVIHSYTSGWKGADKFDDPTPGAIDFIKAARERFNIAIHSSRFNYPRAYEATIDWLVHHGLSWTCIASYQEWVARGGDWFNWQFDAVVMTASKPPAFLTIDDRAITFTGTWPDPGSLLEFQPWNKRCLPNDR